MEAAERAYREAVTQEYNAFGFAGFGRVAPSREQLRLDQVHLEDIFVRLRLVAEQDERHQHTKPSKKQDERHQYAKSREDHAATEPNERQSEREQPITLVEALGKPLLLVGEPGAGKSTLLRWLAVTFAQGRQRDPDRLGPTADAERLPILLELGRLPDAYLTEESRLLPDWQTLLPEEITRQARFHSTPLELFQQALKAGRCLLLFDGLDEIANRQARARLAQSLARMPGLFPGNRVVVGTRPAGLTGESEGALRPSFQCCQIQRFTPDDLQRFFRFWYGLDQTLSSEARLREADALYERIKTTPGTLSLAGTPLLATLLLLIWHKEGTLPERRAELYERCCRALVEEWEQSHDVAYRGLYAALGWEQHLRLLAPIAYEIHRQEQRASISQEALRKLLEDGLQAGKLCQADTAGLEATRFLETLALRSGLLQFQGDGKYGFPHLTIQEYLAARHLALQPDPVLIDEIMAHLHEVWWQEVHLLTIGRLGSDSEGAVQVATLMRAILHRYRPPSHFLRSSRLWWVRLITPGRWLPRVQLARRLAWLLRREEMFALWGTAECAHDGFSSALRDDLAAQAAALAQTMLTDKARRPLLNAWLCAPGRQLPPEASKAIARTLLVALRAPDEEVRRAAAQGLGQVGRGQPEAIAALLAASHDPDEAVCRAAAESLEQTGRGDPEAIVSLLASLRNENWLARQAAVKSLGRLGEGSPEVIATLLEALHDKEYFVRAAAAESLGQVGNGRPEVIAALLEAVFDESAFVRGPAAKSLGQVGSGRPEVIVTLLAASLDADWSRRAGAARGLGQVGSGQPEIITTLLAALRDANTSVSQAAAMSLGQLGRGRPEVIQALLEVALSSLDEEVRRPAVESLGQVGRRQPEIIATMLAALRDASGGVRLAAVRSLSQLGSGQPEVIQALLEVALRDTDGQVRLAAVKSLGQLGSGQLEVIQALLEALHDERWIVREGAARGLGQVGSGQPEVIQALLEVALRDTDRQVRRTAAESLGQMKIADVEQLQLVLVVLNRRLYALHDYERAEALRSIAQLVAGRALPGSQWKLVQVQPEFARRRKQVGALAAGTLVLLALILGGAWLSGISPFNSLFAGLGSTIGLVAGLAGLAGMTLRDLWNRWNRDRDHKHS